MRTNWRKLKGLENHVTHVVGPVFNNIRKLEGLDTLTELVDLHGQLQIKFNVSPSPSCVSWNWVQSDTKKRTFEGDSSISVFGSERTRFEEIENLEAFRICNVSTRVLSSTDWQWTKTPCESHHELYLSLNGLQDWGLDFLTRLTTLDLGANQIESLRTRTFEFVRGILDKRQQNPTLRSWSPEESQIAAKPFILKEIPCNAIPSVPFLYKTTVCGLLFRSYFNLTFSRSSHIL